LTLDLARKPISIFQDHALKSRGTLVEPAFVNIFRRGFVQKSSHAQSTGRQNQLLHLVFGGKLEPGSIEFRDLDQLGIVCVYPNHATVYATWKAKARKTVDNAHMRYFSVHLHRMLDPECPGRVVR
jgi:hypothetical protein